ncbi:MAG: sodium:proton antiporter [Clostridiales bacterium]|nr:sodium:proton antiporter [Clostridiales bacterium]
MQVTQAYQWLWTGALVVLALLTLACLIRSIIGPRIADRIVSINMISTISLAMIAILTRVLGEGYLADVALIYALLGFLAVVVLCKVFMGIALEKKEREEKKNG